MTRLLEKALRKSNAVDREALCIVAGQKVCLLSRALVATAGNVSGTYADGTRVHL